MATDRTLCRGSPDPERAPSMGQNRLSENRTMQVVTMSGNRTTPTEYFLVEKCQRCPRSECQRYPWLHNATALLNQVRAGGVCTGPPALIGESSTSVIAAPVVAAAAATADGSG